MSDVSGGPGWWQASDGKWYPPHLHPQYQHPTATAAPSVAAAAQPGDEFAFGGGSGQPGRMSRRPLYIAGGVVAAILVVVILVVALSGGSSAPLSDGTPSGEGFVCFNTLYLTWTTSGGHVHGLAQGTMSADRLALTGTQSGNHVRLVIQGQPATGDITATGLNLHTGSGTTLSCTLETHAQFEAQAGRLGPGIQSSEDDRAAQANLINALTTAKAEYVNNQMYAPTSQYVTQLQSDEPALHFTAGPSTSEADISVFVAPNGQSIILASRSASTRCWYAVDSEQNVTAPGLPGSEPVHLGTWYNASPGGTTLQNCSAAAPTLLGPWSSSYPHAG